MPNAAPGQRVQNKYHFSDNLKRVGDFVETYPLTAEDVKKIIFAAHIWAYRKHCRVTTERVYYPEGTAARITVVSNTRKERNQ